MIAFRRLFSTSVVVGVFLLCAPANAVAGTWSYTGPGAYTSAESGGCNTTVAEACTATSGPCANVGDQCYTLSGGVGQGCQEEVYTCTAAAPSGCTLACGYTLQWHAQPTYDLDDFTCPAGERIQTSGGSWSGGSCGAGTFTRDFPAAGTLTCVSDSACAAPIPTATLSGLDSRVSYNGATTLIYSATNATTCNSPTGTWSPNPPLGGVYPTPPLTSSVTYTYQCSGPGGLSQLKSFSVEVFPEFMLSIPAPYPTVTLPTASFSQPYSLIGGDASTVCALLDSNRALVSAFGPCTGIIWGTVADVPGPQNFIIQAFKNYSGEKREAVFTVDVKGRNCDPGVRDVSCNVSGVASGQTSGACVASYTLGSCEYSCNNGTWTRVTNTCAQPSPMTVSASASPSSLTLPATQFTVTYSILNKTPNAQCALLASDGATILKNDAACSGSIAYNTPSTAGSYGYYVQAKDSVTGATALSPKMTVDVTELGCSPAIRLNCSLPAASGSQTVSGACVSGTQGACQYKCNSGVWEQVTYTCALPTPMSVTASISPLSLRLPATQVIVTYSILNKTANAQCFLLASDGTTVLKNDLPCSGSIAWNTPNVSGSFGYYMQAKDSVTGATANSNLMSVNVTEAGCTATTKRDCSLPASPGGQVVSGACVNGTQGACQYICSDGSWSAIPVTYTCVAPSPMTVSASASPSSLTLPATQFTVTYSILNKTPNAQCALLASDGATILKNDAACSGSIAYNTPSTAGSYGYYVQAKDSVTGATALSPKMTVDAANAGLAPTISSSGAINPTPKGATLTATINPQGSQTNIAFHYAAINGTCDQIFSNQLGAIGPTSGPINGSSPVYVDTGPNLNSLDSGTTYYACVIATNIFGVTKGVPFQFTTSVAQAPVPNCSFTGPASVSVGQSALLIWDCGTSATSCNYFGFVPKQKSADGTNGNALVQPVAPKTSYQLQCVNGNSQPVTNTVTINVVSPQVTITANPARVDVQENMTNSSTITWESKEMKSCQVYKNGAKLEGWTGLSDRKTEENIRTQTVYRVECKDASGQMSSSSVTVNVTQHFQNF